MPDFFPIQTSFLGGEISPRLAGRVDADIYKAACSRMRNWEPLPQGPARLRPSTKFLATLLNATELSRVVNFRTKSGRDYAIILDGTNVSVFDRNGPVTSADTEFVTNGDFAQGGTGWTTAGSGVVFTNNCFMTHGVNQDTPSVSQNLTLSPGDYTLRINVVTLRGTTHKFRVRVGTELDTLISATGAFAFTFTVSSGGTKALTISSNVTSNIGVLDGSFDDVSVKVANPIVGVITVASPWTAVQLADVQWTTDVANDRIIFVHPNVEPRVLGVATGTWSFTAFTAIAGGVKPAQWTGTNWPSVVEFYQGRLWMAATPNERNWLWGSTVTNIFNFTVGANPGNGFEFRAATKNAFKWLRGQRTMLAGTDYSELSITAASVVVSSGDIQIREESAFGSAGPAENIGDQTVYVSPDRRKLRALLFNLDTDGYVSTDLTFPAEHLTESGIKDIFWARDPNTTIGCLLNDGTMAMCSYDRQKMAAWWKWSTNGSVVSAAYSVAEGAAWLVVKRNAFFHLEQWTAAETGDSRYNLDAYVTEIQTFSYVPGGQVLIAGLDRFEGMTADVTLAGKYRGKFLVVDGTAFVQTDLEDVDLNPMIAGLAYPENLLKPVPLEGGQPGGSSQGLKKRRFGLTLRLNDSALPLVNGRRAPDRGVTTELDTVEPRTTGDVVMTQLGWTEGADVEISQDLPLRTEVCAIFGQTAVRSV